MRTGRDAVIIATGLLLVVLLLSGCPQWLHLDRWYIAFVHHFFHVNIFHLAVNCFSLWMMWSNPLTFFSKTQIILAYMLASASWFFSPVDVAGASNFIFALIGLRTPSFKSEWWKRQSVIVFLVVTVLMAVFPQVSAVTHIVSFIFGCIGAATLRVLKKIGNDIRRASYN